MRNKEIDIMRGTAIILMVIGHSGFIYKDYIYLFHMAVFFMISGYLYSPKYSKNLSSVFDLVKKRIKSLWLPCFLYTLVFILLNNFFIKVNIYTDNPEFAVLTPSAHKELAHYMSAKEMIIGVVKSFFFLGESQLGGVFWFFNTLFAMTIFFCISDFLLNKTIKTETKRLALHIVFALVFLIIGYIEILPINMLNRFLSCYCLFVVGFLIKLKVSPLLNFKSSYYIIGFAVSFIVLLFMYHKGHISLNINTYENPFFLLVASLLGWILIYSFSKLLLAIEWAKRINITIELLGTHTVSIAALHFLAFKIVTIIQIILYQKPMILVASYPVCYSDHGWWIMYTIAGLYVPLIIQLTFNKILDILNHDKHENY